MSTEVRFESQGAYAALEIWDDNKTATLAALNATFKRRGAGTKVLELALEYADLKGLTVVLQVSPFGDAVHRVDDALGECQVVAGARCHDGDP